MPQRVLLPVLLCLLSACAPYEARAPVGDRTQRPASIPASHTVRIGDTLFSVAFLYGLSVDEIAAWNGLREPYLIYGGQKLRLTPPPKSAPAPAAAAPAKRQPQPQPQPAPSLPKVQASQPRPDWSQVPASQPKTGAPGAAAPIVAAPATSRPGPVATAPAIRPEPAFAADIVWKWPADGRLIRSYDATASGKKGIDIAGKTGDDVRAAASGKVVYSGSGLSGYGRLIIIKHNNDFLSAYAHNRELVATEGQWVKGNEVIARMGSSGTDRTMLHFEIRKQGRPVDPLRYLPRR
ncbi:MAG: peptidoglycan DD-metalloendopeptidase family protein [Thiogranum sp.]|nr:peptidoglycan DD-metalloendopeptidase family protein [Thiogranum sp.]